MVSTWLYAFLELNVLYEEAGVPEDSKGDLQCMVVLQLVSKLLDRFTELGDIQLYGFNCLSHVFKLSEVDVSHTY